MKAQRRAQLFQALPATILTLTSVVTGLLVFGVLQWNGLLRQLFEVPWLPTRLILLLALTLCFCLLWFCWERPGQVLAGWWLIGLILLTGLGFSLSFVQAVKEEPWFHATSVAIIAAALVLTPRWWLWRLRPSNPWIRGISVSCVSGCIFMVLLAGCLGNMVLADKQEELARSFSFLESLNADLREILAADWRALALEPRTGREWIKQLENLSIEDKLTDRKLWATAQTLGEAASYKARIVEVAQSLETAFEPARAPRLSELPIDSAVRWDERDQVWVVNRSFLRTSQVVGGYHHHFARLLAELAGSGLDCEPIRFAVNKAHAYAHGLAENWADYWLVQRFPADWQQLEKTPLGDALAMSLIWGTQSYRPADLWWLMSMTEIRARELARRSKDCRWLAPGLDDPTDRRLVCHAYAAAGEGLGARLEIGLYVTYLGPSRPAQAEFIFPVPSGFQESGSSYRDSVRQQFAEAVRQHWSGTFQTLQEEFPDHGFRLISDEAELGVANPRPIAFVDQQQAVKIEVEWLTPLPTMLVGQESDDE